MKTQTAIPQATIPEFWFIDTTPTVGWYLKGGIWTHEGWNPALRIIAVYLELRDIPEARTELEQCHEQFMIKIAPKALKWGILQKETTRRTGTVDFRQLNVAPSSPENHQLLTDIFTPWVNKWALGSKPMLGWVIAASTFTGICQPLGLKIKQLRTQQGNLAKGVLAGLNQFSPELTWAWDLLLSGDYNRAQKTARELARRTVQLEGYSHIEERALLVQARWWILVYILGYLEGDVLSLIAKQEPSGGSTVQYLSDRLRLFNHALGIKPSRGRPRQKHTKMTF